MVSLTELIILHHTKTGDSSIVVHALSKEYGRKSFFVRGVGKNAVMTAFLPMNIVECEISDSVRSSLQTARKPVLMYPLLGIRNNLYKNSMTMFMSEVLYRVVKDGVCEPGLYEWCRGNILLLDALEADFSNFHIRFLLELAVKLGFMPTEEALAPFAGRHLGLVGRFLKEPFSQTMLIPLNGQVRGEMAESILEYIGYHTESSLDVRSLRVLHEILC